MGHDHDHHDSVNYYTEQLCTIGICGGMGLVAVLLASKPAVLGLILHPVFHRYVFWGGVALLVAVAIRALCVWKTVGPTAHDHEHDHGHEHDCCGEHAACSAHEHEHHHHHDHDHDHAHAHAHSHDGHDHAWNPWRYAVLLLPIVLYFLNLPSKGFSDSFVSQFTLDGVTGGAAANFSSEVGIQVEKDADGGAIRVQKVNSNTPAEKIGIQVGDAITQITNETDSDGKPLPKPDIVATKDMKVEAVIEKLRGKAGTKVKLTLLRAGQPVEVEAVRDDQVIALEFKELDRAALNAQARDYYTGRKGRLKGQFNPTADSNRFTLMRMKMTCCAADVVALMVIIEAPESVQSFAKGEWVEAEGQIVFAQANNKFIPVIQVPSMDKIQRTPAESDAYIRQ